MLATFGEFQPLRLCFFTKIQGRLALLSWFWQAQWEGCSGQNLQVFCCKKKCCEIWQGSEDGQNNEYAGAFESYGQKLMLFSKWQGVEEDVWACVGADCCAHRFQLFGSSILPIPTKPTSLRGCTRLLREIKISTYPSAGLRKSLYSSNTHF